MMLCLVATAPVVVPSALAAQNPVAAQEKVNVNTATSKELEKLSGIGKVAAQRIIEYRTEKGAFTSIEDLTKVKGIGQSTLEKIRSQITLQ